MDGQCDIGDAPHGRNWIITRIAPNLTIELCDDHEAIGLVNLTAIVLGVDPGRFYTAVAKFTKGEALKADKELAKEQAAAAAAASQPPPPPEVHDYDQPDREGSDGHPLAFADDEETTVS